MEWQATDQFGNLYIGESDAQSFEELRPHLAQLIEELHGRAGDQFRVGVDFDYREVCGPDPQQVSHIVRIPWMASQTPDEFMPTLATIVAEICAEKGLNDVTVVRA